jgi:hypothetical protein
MRFIRALPVVAALALVLAGTVSAGVVNVDWDEQAKLHGSPVISFHVQALVSKTSGKVSGWGVVASMTNKTSKPLQIKTNQFGLALFKDGKTLDPRRATLLAAAGFNPPVPKVLGPGKTWRGTFAGVGTPPEGSYVRVLFGWFSGPAVGGSGFNWLSDHVHQWCTGKSCSTYGA